MFNNLSHLESFQSEMILFMYAHTFLHLQVEFVETITLDPWSSVHLTTEKPIIHRDVKSSNILLTESMRAKVADFGFAKLGPMESDETHISTKVKGTVGYLDPEYMKTYQLTAKSDVYSFGILLMEIMTGRRPVELRRPVEERVTVRWVSFLFLNKQVLDYVVIIEPEHFLLKNIFYIDYIQ